MQPKIFLVGEAFGEAEAKLGHPFVGPSGALLLRLLADAKVIELTKGDRYLLNRAYETNDPSFIERVWSGPTVQHLYRTNVFNLHSPGNELSFFCGPKQSAIAGYPQLLPGVSGWVQAKFEPELDRLADEILTRDPNLLIGLGGCSLWALCGRVGIKKWRGYTTSTSHTVSDFKFLPTYHPAYVLRDWSSRSIVIADLIKARRQASFPDLRRPQREIWIEPTVEDIKRFFAIHLDRSRPLSVDIETSGSRITCIGLGYREIAIVVPFDDDRQKSRSFWKDLETERTCWDLIRGILQDRSTPKLFQNGLYDIAFLWRSMRIQVLGAIHDTMLLHHSLQPEMEKSLGFLGSIYTDECAWKNLAQHKKTIKRDD